MTDLKNNMTSLAIEDDIGSSHLNLPTKRSSSAHTNLSLKPSPPTDEVVSSIDIDGIQIEMVEQGDKTIYRLPGTLTVNSLDPQKRILVLQKIEKLHNQQLKNKQQRLEKKLTSKSNVNLNSLRSVNSNQNFDKVKQRAFMPKNSSLTPKSKKPSLNSSLSSSASNIYSITPGFNYTNPSYTKSSSNLISKPIAIKPRSNANLSTTSPHDSISAESNTTPFNFYQQQMTNSFPAPVPTNTSNLVNINSNQMNYNYINTPTHLNPLTNNIDNHFQSFINALQSQTPHNSHQSIVQSLLSISENINPNTPILPNSQFTYPIKNINGIDTKDFNQINNLAKLDPKGVLASNFFDNILSSTKVLTPNVLKYSENNLKESSFSYKQNSSLGTHASNKAELNSAAGILSSKKSPIYGKRHLNLLSAKNKNIHNLIKQTKRERQKHNLALAHGNKALGNKKTIWDFGTSVKHVDFENLQKSSIQLEHIQSVKRKYNDVLNADYRSCMNPVINRPFENSNDVIQRLLPYHVYQGNPITTTEVTAYQKLIKKSANSISSKFNNLQSRINSISKPGGLCDTKLEPELNLLIESNLLETLRSSTFSFGELGQ
ncbi:hypothetical protein BB561_005815 [Smittium simulii]|uniref:GLTSCR protein conserved domain-containing protein n=1 Tax=Smittium simulii TaxID=133385 RepID=A0A2T9Y882_9FUNG|nr:hypothetical protein BB561_005815 [Smittium simulii]